MLLGLTALAPTVVAQDQNNDTSEAPAESTGGDLNLDVLLGLPQCAVSDEVSLMTKMPKTNTTRWHASLKCDKNQPSAKRPTSSAFANHPPSMEKQRNA